MMYYALAHIEPSPVDPTQGPGTVVFCTVGGLHPVAIAVEMSRQAGRRHIVTFYAPIDAVGLRAFASTGGMVVAPQEPPARVEPPPLPHLRVVDPEEES